MGNIEAFAKGKGKILGVDFDGTIAEHDGDLMKPGKLFPGVKEALQKLHDQGVYIIITSCRNSTSINEDKEFIKNILKAMKDFLDKNEIPYDEIDDGTKGKVYFQHYIGNEAHRFEGDWNASGEELMRAFFPDEDLF